MTAKQKNKLCNEESKGKMVKKNDDDDNFRNEKKKKKY